MDKIPLQSLRKVEKISTEDRINELTVQVASVNRNFKPTVQTRREFEPDDTVVFDNAYEEKLIEIEADVEDIYLKDTLALIDQELHMWKEDYKFLLEEYHKLHDDAPNDQKLLKASDKRIKALLARISSVEHIKKSLMKEVDSLCMKLEKNKADASDKLMRTNDNYKEIIRFLNRGFESERKNFQLTAEILRKLEHTLRDTTNQLQNIQANAEVLTEELKKSKHQLHSSQKLLQDNDVATRKLKAEIRQLEMDLEDAFDRADHAENSLKRYRNKAH